MAFLKLVRKPPQDVLDTIMKINQYIGNGAYCYANSVAMLLSSIGENISPLVIEVLCGIGLSAFYIEKSNLLYFNFALPDEELSRALRVLGFECTERVISKKLPVPFEQLNLDLKHSPVVIGPIDMGYLTYNPNNRFLYGSDHYIFVYDYDGENYYLHDPEKYPCALLSHHQLENSWISNKIGYGLENYRYWTLPKRVAKPTENEIYDKALKDFKSIYLNREKKSLLNNWTTGEDAILKSADRFRMHTFSQLEVDHFVSFVFPVGAKRALDFALFFEKRSPRLSELKIEQAKLFGKCQTLATSKDWLALELCLRQFAVVESDFRESILAQ